MCFFWEMCFRKFVPQQVFHFWTLILSWTLTCLNKDIGNSWDLWFGTYPRPSLRPRQISVWAKVSTTVPGANPWYFLSTEKETTLQAEPLRKSGAASEYWLPSLCPSFVPGKILWESSRSKCLWSKSSMIFKWARLLEAVWDRLMWCVLPFFCTLLLLIQSRSFYTRKN